MTTVRCASVACVIPWPDSQSKDLIGVEQEATKRLDIKWNVICSTGLVQREEKRTR